MRIRILLLTCSCLPMLAQAALTSSYDWEVRNTYVGIIGQVADRQTFIASDADQSATGQLVSYGTTSLAYENFPTPDGETGSGPEPDIQVQAEATGRTLRVQTSIEHLRSCIPPMCNGVSNNGAIWSARWSANARAISFDTLTIAGDPSLNGLAGSFLLPIHLTGQINLDQDHFFSMGTQPTFNIRTADQNGITTANAQRSYPNNWIRNGVVNDVIDESFSLIVPFVFNEDFDLISSFSSNASASVFSSGNLFQLTQLIVSSDFANTVVLEGFTDFLVDSDGDGVPDAPVDPELLQISSLEGIDYLGDPAVIPVPAAAWLFLSGLIGLVGVARKSS